MYETNTPPPAPIWTSRCKAKEGFLTSMSSMSRKNPCIIPCKAKKIFIVHDEYRSCTGSSVAPYIGKILRVREVTDRRSALVHPAEGHVVTERRSALTNPTWAHMVTRGYGARRCHSILVHPGVTWLNTKAFIRRCCCLALSYMFCMDFVG